jgi:hypothetical protein
VIRDLTDPRAAAVIQRHKRYWYNETVERPLFRIQKFSMSAALKWQAARAVSESDIARGRCLLLAVCAAHKSQGGVENE